jgi:hypothetical protein
MKKKDCKPTSVGRQNFRQTPAEKKAIKVFNAELQKAIDLVDWAKVNLPRQCC